ncbi:bestrophin family protein [Spirosoma lituiforme]
MLLNKPIPILFFIREIRREASLVFLFANLVVVIKLAFNLWFLTVPVAIPALLGTCISLLLAFRTNQSYERWWEARIAWGAIVNDSRSFVRQLQMFLPNSPDRNTLLHAFVNRQCAWCYVLGDSLRGVDPTGRLREFLPGSEIELIAKADNKANVLLLNHGIAIRQLYLSGQLTDYQMVQLSNSLTSFTDSMGRCERIKNTVFPRTYTFNMQVFIYLFAAVLPFCFDYDLYYLDVPIVTLIASAFILIEKSGIQLQDPFENKPTDTPMTTIARTIEVNLKTMTGFELIPEKLATNEYYAL